MRGPEDEFDPALNGDPDGQSGEEDEDEPTSFEEMHDWPEPDFEGEDDDGEDEGEC